MDDETLDQALKTAWHRFVDDTQAHRADLFRYCRRLTGNLWDAEDLVQDTLTRAYGRWGMTIPVVENPRAYLMRTAANVWIDEIRRRLPVVEADVDTLEDPNQSVDDPDLVELHEGSERLLQRLAPREQAAVVMRETFGMTAAEIATTLGTTEGAVKAALHRGRRRLGVTTDNGRNAPSRELVERFVALFRERDLQGLAALFADSGTAENVGNSWHIGNGPRGFPAVLHGCVMGHDEWPEGEQRTTTGVEIVDFDGEFIVLSSTIEAGRAGLSSVFRIEEEDGRIVRFRSYGFCQEFMAEIAERFDKPHNRYGYRAPTPAPGMDWDQGHRRADDDAP